MKGCIKKMKQTIKTSISIVISILFLFALVACNTVDKSGIWEEATYLRDKEFGKGSKTLVVEVKAADQMVTFTIHTDQETVGEALMEHDLLAGEEGAYGLYVKKVNGMTADFDVDGYYWAFYIDGDLALTGVDGAKIEEGVTYQLECTKG
jgi:hypothetical protein